MSASKRMSRIEVKSADAIDALAEEERRKKAEVLEKWREKNCVRLSWDLFALLEGPKLEHPGNYKKEEGDDEESNAFVDSHLAYFDMIERVLKHGIDEDGFINVVGMSKEEMAFAVCLEGLFWRFEADDWLLNRGIQDQAIALGIGLALHKGEISIADAVAKIDEHRGGPEWRQICATNAEQEEMDSRWGIPTIKEIPKPGRAWVDPPDRLKRHSRGYINVRG
jgi:hypothetical protein